MNRPIARRTGAPGAPPDDSRSARPPAGRAKRESPHVTRIVQLIEAQYDRSITVATLAKALGRRPTYLSRVFRHDRGCGIHAFIVRTRMREAERLLREGEKVEAVALFVGYKSRPNFYRQFKKYFGMAPAAFRERVTKRSRS